MAVAEYLIPMIMAIIYFVPVLLLLIGAVLVKRRIGGASGIIIAIGAVLLAFSSSYSIGNYIVAARGIVEDVRDFALKWGMISEICGILAVILIGLGMILLAKRSRSVDRYFE